MASKDNSNGKAAPAAAQAKAEPGPGRRRFLKTAGLAGLGAAAGLAVPFHQNLPQEFFPAAMASDNGLAGKEGLTLLNNRPLNAETPPELLDDPVTRTARHFIRNNGLARTTPARRAGH
ncbi:twin-arginine translocation pathway signal [Rhodobacterales bacterium Y4I]|nr:twin-arginine translocation pathway signal [Rhodobacterales bacterium Y4I]